LVGDAAEGVIYPLRLKTDKYAVIGGDNPTWLEGKDYYREARLQLGNAVDEDEIIELAWELESNDPDGLYSRIYNALQDTDIYADDMARQSVMDAIADDLADNSVRVSDIDSAIRANVTEAYDDAGEMVSPGEISRQVLQNLGFEGVIDNTVDSKLGSNRVGFAGARIPGMSGVMPDTQHIVTFPGKENTIRSVNAAFDPAKSDSPNLLAGGAAAAVGLGAATQGEEAEAVTDSGMAFASAANEFSQRREQKRSQWQSLRADLLDAFTQADQAIAAFTQPALDAIDLPWKGILGATRVAGGLAAGESFNQAMNQGATLVRQPLERTAYDLGGQVTDATGSPLAGTAVNAGIQLGGPI
jgi:hypothetical protein